MKRRIPRRACFDHGVEDGQEFSHTGDERDLLGFARGHEAVIEELDGGVVASSHERGHVQNAPHATASTEDGALAAHAARVAVDGRYADQRANLAARGPAQFWNLGNQSGNGYLADPLDTAEQRGKIGKVRLDMLGHIAVDSFECLEQSFDDRVDTLLGLGMRQSQPVTLGAEHRDELPTARYPRGQGLLLGAGQRFDEFLALGMALDDLAELGQNARINMIGLGQLPDRACEVPHLFRIDDGHSVARRLQGTAAADSRPPVASITINATGCVASCVSKASKPSLSLLRLSGGAFMPMATSSVFLATSIPTVRRVEVGSGRLVLPLLVHAN